MIKFPALSYRSTIIPMRDTENLQTEEKELKITRRSTTHNETSAKKINESTSTNIAREIEQISSGKYHFLLILYIFM